MVKSGGLGNKGMGPGGLGGLGVPLGGEPGGEKMGAEKTTPGQIRAQQEKVGQGLNQKEAHKALKKQQEKLSPQDLARLASQAGFSRAQRRTGKKGEFDIGDGSGQQFALPPDDVDPEAWSQETLESAQGSLSLASSQFGEVARSAPGEAPPMAAALVGSSFTPTEEDLAEMELLAERKPPHPIPMLEELSGSVSTLFGIELSDDVPVGHKVLAAGLLVAGERESVQVDKGKIEEQVLAGGIQKVTKRGNQAVGEAQRMNKGVHEKLNLQRTFVFKR